MNTFSTTLFWYISQFQLKTGHYYKIHAEMPLPFLWIYVREIHTDTLMVSYCYARLLEIRMGQKKIFYSDSYAAPICEIVPMLIPFQCGISIYDIPN